MDSCNSAKNYIRCHLSLYSKFIFNLDSCKKKIGATRAVDLIHGLIISEDLAKASLCGAESNESIGSLEFRCLCYCWSL